MLQPAASVLYVVEIESSTAEASTKYFRFARTHLPTEKISKKTLFELRSDNFEPRTFRSSYSEIWTGNATSKLGQIPKQPLNSDWDVGIVKKKQNFMKRQNSMQRFLTTLPFSLGKGDWKTTEIKSWRKWQKFTVFAAQTSKTNIRKVPMC